MISISIKDLRRNLSKVGDAVSAGQSFTVFRRSRPIGKFVPLNTPSRHGIEEVDELEDEEGWEDFIDFTQGGKKEGMPIEEAIELFEKINNEE